MLIKICGLTNLEEINSVNELKPEYIGFVFTNSKRQVGTELAKNLYDALDKNIKVVGVFKNNDEQFILNVLNEVPLDVVQLHGDEDGDFINKLKEKVRCDIWKAVGVKTKQDLVDADKYPVDTLLLDGSDPGSGQIFPWDALDGMSINKRIFLAGGINEDNVLEGISRINPDGIDTSSGVEIVDEKGRRKSKDKMEILIRKVRER